MRFPEILFVEDAHVLVCLPKGKELVLRKGFSEGEREAF
jgi:hypothetical protein